MDVVHDLDFAFLTLSSKKNSDPVVVTANMYVVHLRAEATRLTAGRRVESLC